jgi:hypothetical protein
VADGGIETASLETRLEELQVELQRVEAALEELHRAGGAAPAE